TPGLTGASRQPAGPAPTPRRPEPGTAPRHTSGPVPGAAPPASDPGSLAHVSATSGTISRNPGGRVAESPILWERIDRLTRIFHLEFDEPSSGSEQSEVEYELLRMRGPR